MIRLFFSGLIYFLLYFASGYLSEFLPPSNCAPSSFVWLLCLIVSSGFGVFHLDPKVHREIVFESIFQVGPFLFTFFPIHSYSSLTISRWSRGQPTSTDPVRLLGFLFLKSIFHFFLLSGPHHFSAETASTQMSQMSSSSMYQMLYTFTSQASYRLID